MSGLLDNQLGIYFECQEHEDMWYSLLDRYNANNDTEKASLLYIQSASIMDRIKLYDDSDGDFRFSMNTLKNIGYYSSSERRMIKLAWCLWRGSGEAPYFMENREQQWDWVNSLAIPELMYALDEENKEIFIQAIRIRYRMD